MWDGLGMPPLSGRRPVMALGDTKSSPWFAPKPDVNELGIGQYQKAPLHVGMANPPHNPKVRRELLAYLEANGIIPPPAPAALPPVPMRQKSASAKAAVETVVMLGESNSPGAKRKRLSRATGVQPARPASPGMQRTASLPSISGRTPARRNGRDGGYARDSHGDASAQRSAIARRGGLAATLARDGAAFADMTPDPRHNADACDVRPGRNILREEADVLRDFSSSLKRALSVADIRTDLADLEGSPDHNGVVDGGDEKPKTRLPRELKAIVSGALGLGPATPSKGSDGRSPTSQACEEEEDELVDAFQRLDALNKKPFVPTSKASARPAGRRRQREMTEAEEYIMVARLKEKTRHIKLSEAGMSGA